MTSSQTSPAATDAPVAAGTVGAPAPAAAPASGVTVRYWAAARAAAGTDSDVQPGDTVGSVVDAAVAAHPGLERVARVATFLLDGRKVGRETSVPAGATVEVLPPFAGG
ncbi:MoaD/ThiS family protein [Intrasporangium flavum]|uniref:MoaD/ThiS family protein n=1 Tax=Intrasporangium flavum TaxID=1428657 RepID=UPI0009F9221D|nr:MoaD/ThiS family protein [Intrasporangium flavum]